MNNMTADQIVWMAFFFLLPFVEVILDFFLIAAVVALYYSFIKRWRLYSKVTQQLRKAMKKHL